MALFTRSAGVTGTLAASQVTFTPTGTIAATNAQAAIAEVAAEAVSGTPYTDEQVRDVVGAALIAGVGGLVTVNDAGDTITVMPNPVEPAAALTTVTSTQDVPNPSTTGQTWIPYTVDKNVTFTFPAVSRGKSFTLELRQDATGGRTYTWPGTVKWPAGVAPTPSGANKIDLISFSSDGTSWLGVSAMNY